MAADSDKQRSSSVSSLKRTETGDARLQLLSPEGSEVYMTDVSTTTWQDSHRHGNPVTNKGTTLLGVPRKTSNTKLETSLSPDGVSHDLDDSNGTGLDAATNQLSELAIAKESGKDVIKNESTSSGSSDSDEDDDGDVLERAGVEGIDLENMLIGEDGKAPIELVSQFLSCLMRNEYEAAQILCKKVIELEPQNETAAQFYPLIQQRIQLDNELPTESSSSESDEDDGDSSSDESTSSESSSEEDDKHSDIGREVGAQPSHSQKNHCNHNTSTWQP